MVLALLSLPAFLFSYAWGLKLTLIAAGPIWGTAIVASHIIVFLGFGCLIDSRQSRVMILPPEQ